MSGKQGKPVPPHIKQFILDTAEADPTLTNSDVKRVTEEKFNRPVDSSTVAKFRREAGIPSSRKAASQVPTSPLLTNDRQISVQKLLNKLVQPHPDQLRLTNVIIGVGEGAIGPQGKKVHIRLDGLKLTECWLSAVEVKYLVTALTKIPDLQAMFLSVLEQGIEIVNDILGYNQGIDFGNGESSFSELLQLLENNKPENLGPFERNASRLWNRYTSFGKELADFRRRFEESQSV
ncbi:hypothetical protein JYU04_02590 [Dehalococcoides mccartyi]|nr:hypothetical protein [Dehalococcoides mccartyi]